VLTTLSLDRDGALEAAARIVAARTNHAQQGASLAYEVFDRWRDTDQAVMAVIAVLHGQPAAIGISHDTGLNPGSPPFTQARRP
jgi:hypothetical protein